MNKLWVLHKDYRNGNEIRLFRREFDAVDAMVRDIEESGEIETMGPNKLQHFHDLTRAKRYRDLSEWWGDFYGVFYSWHEQPVE